jgi:hypothetical protein
MFTPSLPVSPHVLRCFRKVIPCFVAEPRNVPGNHPRHLVWMGQSRVPLSLGSQRGSNG